MASRFWVGGTGNWGVTTTNWSATSGGASGASVPTSADDVVFDANSGVGTVTVTATANCASITSTNFGGTFAGSFALNVFGNMALGGAWTYSGTLTFSATATGKTVNTNGKILAGPVTFNGVGGGWTLAAALSTSGAVTFTNGAFSDGGFSLTGASFNSSSANTRTITKTAGWTIAGTGTIINLATITGLTWSDAGGWTCTDSSATSRTVSTSTLSMSNIKVTAGSGTFIVTASGNYGGLDFTGSAVALSNTSFTMYAGDLILGAGMTAADGTQVLTFTGSGTQNIRSNGAAYNRNITFNGTGTVNLLDALSTTRSLTHTQGTFTDNGFSITALNFASSNTNTRALNKTGNWTFTDSGTVINFTTVTGLTATFDATKSWTVANNSATATTVNFGGLANVGHLKVTTGTYTLTFTSNTATAGTFTDVDFTGFSGTMNASPWNQTGNLTISATMALLPATTTFVNSGVATLQSNGVTLNRAITTTGTGVLKPLDALNTGGQTITVTSGGFDDNGFSVSCGIFSSSNTNARTITKTTDWTLTTNTSAIFTTTTNLTANFDNTKSWILTYSGATAGSFGFGNLVAVGHLKVTAGTLLINLNTAAAATGTFNDIDFTGFSGTIGGQGVTLTGNLTYSATMTSTTSGNAFTMIPPIGTTKTLTCNGVTYNRSLIASGAGTVRLADALDTGVRAITVTSGTFDVNGKAIASGTFSASGGAVINAGGTSLTLSGVANVFIANPSAATIAYADMWSTVKITDTTAATKALLVGNPGGYHFKTVWFAPGAGGSELDVNGANTIDTLKCDATAACSIAFQESQTQTVNALDMAPDATKVITFKSKTPGTQYTLQNGSGAKYSRDYMAAQDMIGLPGYSWFMGGHSSNLGNNLGVAFASPANASLMALEA